MELPDIRLLVPHADKMVLLDRVIAVDDEGLCAEVVIDNDSLFLSDNGVGAWVGVEYMAQAIAAYAGFMARQKNSEIKVGFLLGTRRYECSQDAFKLGSVLQVSAKHIFQAENGLSSFDCTINIAHEQIAKATITVFQPDNVQEFLAAEGQSHG